MPDTRKQFRIALPTSHTGKFQEAKKKAEQSAMIKLSDTQYATRLIQWALDQQDK